MTKEKTVTIMVYVGSLAFNIERTLPAKEERKDSGRLWTVARVTTRKLKKDESGNLHWTADFDPAFPGAGDRCCTGERRKEK